MLPPDLLAFMGVPATELPLGTAPGSAIPTNGPGSNWPGIDVLQYHRSTDGAVALPWLNAIGPIVGRKIESPASVREICRIRIAAAVYVLNKDSPRAVRSLFHNSTPLVPLFAEKRCRR